MTTTLSHEAIAAAPSFKHEYLICYAAAGAQVIGLKQCVTHLLQCGVPWQDLVRWPKEAGCDSPYARKILSNILTEAGIRRRKPGAGRETPPAAFGLLADATEKYGDDAVALLLAAYRAGKARLVASGELALNLKTAVA